MFTVNMLKSLKVQTVSGSDGFVTVKKTSQAVDFSAVLSEIIFTVFCYLTAADSENFTF